MEFGHFNVPSVPMEFICMDLVGPISPQTSKGNKYMLTVIDMLKGYTIAVAIPDKTAETVLPGISRSCVLYLWSKLQNTHG